LEISIFKDQNVKYIIHLVKNYLLMENKIKVYRAMFDLTQEELAERVNVTRQTINAVELGKYSPSIELAFRIARIFNVSIEDVFIYEGVEE